MHPRARDTPVHTVYIHSLLHTSGIYTVNHYQLPMPSFAWVTDIAICCVRLLTVLITKGVFKGYLYVRHLSVTGMTRMTRNMKKYVIVQEDIGMG